MLTIDGAQGEGGGQIFRSAISLALLTQQAVRIERIRAGRTKPGLLRQHLTAVQAAAHISGARMVGAQVGATTLEFYPKPVQAGDYQFAIGTAGSCTLVLQTILLPLALSTGTSRVRLSGGTHNPAAPPADFLRWSFLPLLARMGVECELKIIRHGFYPAGGGEIELTIHPCTQLQPLQLLERGAVQQLSAYALLSGGLRIDIAERELAQVRELLAWDGEQLQTRCLPKEHGPGNVLMLRLQHQQLCEVFTGFGQRGVSAESLGRQVSLRAQYYLDSGVAVGPYLADQLLLPLALAGAGCFSSIAPTAHTLSNIAVIEQFCQQRFVVEQRTPQRWEIALG